MVEHQMPLGKNTPIHTLTRYLLSLLIEAELGSNLLRMYYSSHVNCSENTLRNGSGITPEARLVSIRTSVRGPHPEPPGQCCSIFPPKAKYFAATCSLSAFHNVSSRKDALYQPHL